MAIPEPHRRNFQTPLNAAADGNPALMECSDTASGEARYVICAVGRANGDFVMTPFGHLAEGNPFLNLPPAGMTIALVDHIVGSHAILDLDY